MALSTHKRRRIRDRRLSATVDTLAATTTAIHYSLNFIKRRQHTSKLSGKDWMHELLAGNPRRI